MKLNIERFIRQNKSSILAIAGAIGMVASVGLSIRNTAKYKDIIHSKSNKQIDNIERLKVAVPYILLENSFKQYKDKVLELYGSDATQQVEVELTNDKFEEKNPQLKNSENELFYDEYRGEFFESTLDNVREAMYHVNRNFILKGDATLNEVYDFLNLPHTEQGDVLGWSADYGWCYYGYSWIDYYCDRRESRDGTEYYAIVFPFPPTLEAIEDAIDLESFSPSLIERAKAMSNYDGTQNLQTL